MHQNVVQYHVPHSKYEMRRNIIPPDVETLEEQQTFGDTSLRCFSPWWHFFRKGECMAPLHSCDALPLCTWLQSQTCEIMQEDVTWVSRDSHGESCHVCMDLYIIWIPLRHFQTTGSMVIQTTCLLHIRRESAHIAVSRIQVIEHALQLEGIFQSKDPLGFSDCKTLSTLIPILRPTNYGYISEEAWTLKFELHLSYIITLMNQPTLNHNAKFNFQVIGPWTQWDLPSHHEAGMGANK